MLEDSNRAKIILLCLFLLGLLLGYFLFQRIISSRQESNNQKISAIASIRPSFASLPPTPAASALPVSSPSPSPAVLSQAKKLPSTGAEEDLLAVVALAIVIAGYSIFKYYPN